MNTNIVNIRRVSFVLRNTQATCEALFMKKLSSTEAELKESVPCKKKSCICLD